MYLYCDLYHRGGYHPPLSCPLLIHAPQLPAIAHPSSSGQHCICALYRNQSKFETGATLRGCLVKKTQIAGPRAGGETCVWKSSGGLHKLVSG